MIQAAPCSQSSKLSERTAGSITAIFVRIGDLYFELSDTSPLGWSHISLTGDYLWEQAAVAVDGFRPLNTARSRLKLVA